METTITVPLFESNQILSSTHLNQLRDYLDNEIRISRTKLSGVGIANGLNIKSYDKAAGKIVVSSGYGITTDGYLLELHAPSGTCENVYTHFRAYEDPGAPAYNFGRGRIFQQTGDTLVAEISVAAETVSSTTSSSSFTPRSVVPEPASSSSSSASDSVAEKSIKVIPKYFELFTDGSAEGSKPLTEFGAGLDNMAVVLFLEEKLVDLKSCTGTNCDNKGHKLELTVRLLLVDPVVLYTNDNQKLLTNEDPLHQLNIPRLSNSDLISFDSIAKIQSKYLTKIIDPQKKALANAIGTAFSSYDYLLALSKQNYDKALNCLGTIEKIKNTTGAVIGDIQYVQYVADVLTDATMTFNEFAAAAYTFLRSCGQFPKPFPRHLTLGLLIRKTDNYADVYRNVFFNTPPVDKQDHLFLSAQMLFEKLLHLLIHFQVPGEDPAAESNPKINITPDKLFPLPLADRSVPFYYNAKKLKSDLLPFWNPEQTMHGRETERMGYYAEKYNTDVPSYFLKPFEYSINEFPFLRVEALNGKKKEDAVSTLDKLKDEYNLPFGVVALQLENNPVPTINDYNCGYEDLQLNYLTARSELICSLKHGEDALMPIMNSDGDINQFFLNEINTYIVNPQGNFEAFLKATKSVQEIYDNLTEIFKSASDTLIFTRTYNTLPYFIHQFHYPTFLNNYKELQGFFIRVRAIYTHLQRMVNIWFYYLEIPGYIHTALSKIDWLLSILDRLLNQCTYIKLSIAYYTFKWRVSYFTPKQHVFKEFAKDHPGMEHRCGAEKGGTLVLVYSTTTKLYAEGPANQIVADFMLPGTCCSPCGPTPLEQIDFPPVAMHNYTEITVDSLKLAKEGMFIDVLKNDYLANTSVSAELIAPADPDPRDYISLELIEDNGEMKYLPNAGTVEIRPDPKDGNRMKLFYINKKGKATIDFFRYRVRRVKADGSSWEDSGIAVMNVVEPIAPLLNAKADTASTMEGRKVVIWPKLNDIPASSTVELIDSTGKSILSEMATTYGKVVIGWDAKKGPYLEYNPTEVKNPSSTITDVFFYRLVNPGGQVSQPTPVTVYVLPAHNMASDFASVLVGKKVRIDVLLNDGSPYDGSGELVLLDSLGKKTDPATFTTVEGGKLSIGGSKGHQYFEYQAPTFLKGKQSTATDHFNYCVDVDGELSIPTVATVYVLKETPHNNDIAATVPGKEVIIDVLQNDILPFPMELASIQFIDGKGNELATSVDKLEGKYGTVNIRFDSGLGREVLVYVPVDAKYKQTQVETFNYFASQKIERVKALRTIAIVPEDTEPVVSDPGVVSIYILPKQGMDSDFAAVLTGNSVVIDPAANDGAPYDTASNLILLDSKGVQQDPKTAFKTEIGASVSVQFDAKLNRDILIYTAPATLKQDSATDEFKYIVIGKDFESPEELIEVYVLKSAVNNRNTAATTPGKTVLIDVLSNDVMPFPPKDATLQLLDKSGTATSEKAIAGLYGTMTVTTDSITKLPILQYTATDVKTSQTVYDVFGYQASSGDKKASPGYVTIYIVPAAADSSIGTSFSLPKTTFGRNEATARFTLEAPATLVPDLAVFGNGAYYDGENWLYIPRYGAYAGNSSYCMLYNWNTMEWLSTLMLTVLPTASFTYAYTPATTQSTLPQIELRNYYGDSIGGKLTWTVKIGKSSAQTFEGNPVTVTMPLETSSIIVTLSIDNGAVSASAVPYVNELTRRIHLNPVSVSSSVYSPLASEMIRLLNIILERSKNRFFKKIISDISTQISYELNEICISAIEILQKASLIGQDSSVTDEFNNTTVLDGAMRSTLTQIAQRIGPVLAADDSGTKSAKEQFYSVYQLFILCQLGMKGFKTSKRSGSAQYENIPAEFEYFHYFLLRNSNMSGTDVNVIEFMNLIYNASKDKPAVMSELEYIRDTQL